MSSLVDAVLRSDFDDIPASSPGGLPEPRRARQNGRGPIPSSPAARRRQRSSSRPGATPLAPEDGEDDFMGDPEDEVVGTKGIRPRRLGDIGSIPKVQDQTSETLREIFETFLEEYVPFQCLKV